MALKRKPKMMSILLTLAMLLMLWPGVAVSEAADTISVTTESELIETVANSVYANYTISIDQDITLNSSLTINQDVVLTSTNGSTLNAQTNKITIGEDEDVTFNGDLEVTGSGTTYPVVEVNTGANFTLDENAAVTGINNLVVEVKNGATFTLDGNASVEKTDGTVGHYYYAILNNGTTYIEGGTVASNAVGISNTGTLTVSGGEVDGGANYSGINSNGNLTVTSGTIGSISTIDGLKIATGGTATIEGGIINGKNNALNVASNGTAIISGGTFTASTNNSALSCAGTANLTSGTFNGKVRTITGGNLNITSGTVNIDGIYYHDSGQSRLFLDPLPAPITDATVGVNKIMGLEGMQAGLTYSIDNTKTSGDLRANISNNTVTINPSASGTYNLVLTATASDQTFNLTIPVTVTGDEGTPISIGAITGVTAPVTGETPVTTITATPQYTGTVNWSPAIVDDEFAGATAYTATISLIPETGFTLTGVTDNFFTVAGATATNDAGSGIVTAVFPATISTPLAKPTNLNWFDSSGTVIARWDAVPNAARYEVLLYRNENANTIYLSTHWVDAFTTELDFTTIFPSVGSGTYNFKVKAHPTDGNSLYKASELSESSPSSHTYTAPLQKVLSVSVMPNTITLNKGDIHTFSAIVSGTNNPSQDVIWSVNSTSGSNISSSGLLTVAAGETASSLTVIATSTEDNTKFGTATVTVSQSAPSHTYTVTFMNGSAVHATKTVIEPDATVGTLPVNPTKGSYTFSGWYTGTNGSGNRFYADTSVTSNMTLYAYWTGASSSSSGGGGGTTPSGVLVTSDGQDTSDGGVTLNFPPGAVESDIRVQVREASLTSGMDLPADSQLISQVVDIVKNKSGDFSEPVTITMSFNKSQIDPDKYDIKICYFDEENGEWVELDNIEVDPANGSISGEVTHFTKFAVIATLKASEKEEPPLPPAPQPEPELPADLAGHWAKDSIAKLINARVISGYPDGSFQPDKTISRAEFTVMLVKALQLEPKATSAFKDTAAHWARESISTAAAHGLISGYDQNTFRPDDNITREQAAVIIARAAKLQAEDQKLSFSDVQQIAPWALSGVAAAVSKSYLSGYPDNSFRPQGNTTRAEAAAIIAKLLKN